MAENGMLQEVFGSDLSSDGEELAFRARKRSQSASPRRRASRSRSRSRSRSPPRAGSAAAALADASDDESDGRAAAPRAPAARRPIRFSASDNDDDDDEQEVRPGRRREKKRSGRPAGSGDEEDDGDDDDDAPARRRKDFEKRKRRKEHKLRKGKKARRERSDDDYSEGQGRRDDLADFVDEADRSGGLAGPSGRYENDADAEGEEEERTPKKPLNAFEKALEENKAMRRPRFKEMDPAVVEAECVAFLEKMMKARDEDVKAYERNKPALNKLRLLREVELMAMKVTHREILLDNLMLAIFKAWLDPMKDGALPNIQIRTTLLSILHGLRVDSDWVERLESSQGLGKLIQWLSINETHAPNKRMAEKILRKWARPVYQANSNFHDLLSEFDRPEEGRRAPKDSVAWERKAARETVKNFMTAQEKLRAFKSKTNDGKDDQQVLATIPRRTPFLFTTLAEGSASIDDKQLREMRNAKARNRKVNRTMSLLRRSNKNRSARAAKPSLNGR